MTVTDFPCAVGDPGAIALGPVLATVAEEVPDAELDVEQLGSRIVGLAGRLAAATCRWLLLVAAFDAGGGCARFGLPSTARWLSHHCGIARRTAIEQVRVARALAAQPSLAAAMAAGRLSYSQVRAISRLVECATPGLIDSLIMVAEHGTVGQLEDVVRGLRSVDDVEHGRARPVEEYVRRGWGADSRWTFSARLEPEHGALVQAAVEAIARVEGITQPEAFTRMAEIALAAVSAQTGSGSVPVLRGDDLAAVVVHLDADRVLAAPTEVEPVANHTGSAEPAAAAASDEATRRGAAQSGGTDPGRGGCSAEHPRPYARLAGGPGLPDRVVRRLLCAGRIRTAVLADLGPGLRSGPPGAGVGDAAAGGGCTAGVGRTALDLGRSHRVVSKRLFAGLLLRDGTCRYPGCGSRDRLEAHHIQHWLDGGRTDMANLLIMCRAHHHAHHDGQFSITTLDGGRVRFRRADGRELPSHIDPSTLIAADQPVEDDHPDVAPDAAKPRWDGTRLDRHYAVATLATGLIPPAARSA